MQRLGDWRLYVSDGLDPRHFYSNVRLTQCQAILYATDVWKVKIISLSIGFRKLLLATEEKEIVRNAIKYASTRVTKKATLQNTIIPYKLFRTPK